MTDSTRRGTKSISGLATVTEDEGLFEMANLSPKRTGLPFVVWISPKAGAPHDIRVKVSKSPRARSNELISVALWPELQVVGEGAISSRDLRLLKKWVDLNFDVLLKYWDGTIEYTEDAIEALRPIG